MHEDNDVPVLNAVVKAGNESIIESTRLGREVLQELEAMKSLGASVDDTLETRVEPRDHNTGGPGIGDGSVVHLYAEGPGDAPQQANHSVDEHCDHALPTPAYTDDDELELMIDDLVDRHVSALREDLRRLLLSAQRT